MSEVKPISWSHSRLDTFEKCPKQFWHMNIKKDVPYIESSEMAQGKLVHKMMEDRVGKGVAIPIDYAARLEPLAGSILAAPGKKFVEMQLALDWSRRPCGYRDWDRVACRIQVDVAVINGSSAWLGDYKTGNRKFDEAQLRLSAAGAFAHWPDVSTIKTSYIWLKGTEPITEKSFDSCTYTRDELPDMWEEIQPKVDRLQEANRTGNWVARPNRFCPWCAVNKKGLCNEASGPPRRD